MSRKLSVLVIGVIVISLLIAILLLTRLFGSNINNALTPKMFDNDNEEYVLLEIQEDVSELVGFDIKVDQESAYEAFIYTGFLDDEGKVINTRFSDRGGESFKYEPEKVIIKMGSIDTGNSDSFIQTFSKRGGGLLYALGIEENEDNYVLGIYFDRAYLQEVGEDDLEERLNNFLAYLLLMVGNKSTGVQQADQDRSYFAGQVRNVLNESGLIINVDN